MTRLTKAKGSAALVACLTALLGVGVSSARADTTIACASLSASQGSEASTSLQVARTEPLYRFQQRPYVRIPVGVALWVKAPRGVTAADLHNLLQDCTHQASATSPLCVKDAQIQVERSGGYYVVRVTSDSRTTALEIQRRANAR